MSLDHPALPFELNEDLWFDDGDIRVCARRFDSGRLCLYNLYRDLLAAHSTTLLNLLDKPLAHCYVGDASYAYLPDDDALDLERFLITIHYPIYFFFRKHSDRSFSSMLPVLRTAFKYKASDVIEALAAQLEQDWPQTISEWDAWQLGCEDGVRTESFQGICPENWTFNRIGAAVMESASAIQVSRIANLPNILSVAYYQLSRISSSETWWQDIVSQVLGATKDCNLEKERSARDRGCTKADVQMLLSKEDLRRIVSGKEKLENYMLSLKKCLAQDLVLHPRCAGAWNTRLTMKSEDPLTDLLELCSAEASQGGKMCADCRSLINERGREKRIMIWELLPQVFCLPIQLGTS